MQENEPETLKWHLEPGQREMLGMGEKTPNRGERRVARRAGWPVVDIKGWPCWISGLGMAMCPLVSLIVKI